MSATPGSPFEARGRFGIAAPHPLAAQAGLQVLSDGGNCVDAALAAAAVLAVALPNQCALGGDLIAMVGRPDGTAQVVNASGRAPAGVDVAAVRAAHRWMPLDGGLPVTVPGVVDGWFRLGNTFGTRPVASALSAAAALAREGVPVMAGLARDIDREAARILADPGLAGVLAPGGTPLTAGDRLVQPRLADTLERVAAEGRDGFYAGPVADAVVGFLRDHGSAMTADDLAAHRATLESPLSARFGDQEYLSSGGNTQGGYFLAALRAVESLAADGGPEVLDPLGPWAAQLCRVLAAVGLERDARLGDPGAPASAPLDDDGIEDLAVRIVATSSPTDRDHERARRPTGDTVAIVAADADGGWISLIQSVFHAFGAGLLEPVTGVLLHNRGAAFSLQPDRAGTLTAGHRPPHTLMPVLVRDAATRRLVGAHGTMGGRAQPQIHVHLALHLARGRSPVEAVSAPRWIVGRMDAGETAADVVQYEADVPEPARRALASVGLAAEALSARDDGVGHAQVVRAVTESVGAQVDLLIASDPRAGGAALAGRP